MKPAHATTPDGIGLSVRTYGEPGRSVVVINSATGVPQRYYEPFARWLSAQGHLVVTYDYRGIGESLPGGARLRGFRATMADWAVDASTVLDWASLAHPGARLSVIGHSFGGQCVGLLPDPSRIHRAVFVSSQSGYWRLFNPADRPKLYLIWHVLGPALSRLLGYFPSRKLGFGEDLPAGVMLQWARWCRHPRYLLSEAGSAFETRFDRLSCDVLAIKVVDDAFAPPRAVDELMGWYVNARVQPRVVERAEFGGRPIGHFGVFRERFKDTLWKEMAAWLRP